MPKLNFHDVGLASWLLGIRTANQVSIHPLRGSLIETHIVSELMKAQFNRGGDPFLPW